ncbi:TetR/AcrR family transcriptional regulator [Streptomyces sp. NPDC026673]|uniref:TetR/AcrR family transcriptional regulator n=1 Tax=Streptomyces sp. NPDC026673 TaxID=3155724 RepID=UPI0034030B95
MAERTVLTSDPGTLARDVAAALVRRTSPEADSLDPFLLMLRSAPNPRAAEILRAGIKSHVESHLHDVAPELRGTDRAAMALSVVAGFWLMRKMIGSTALNNADETELARTLERLFTLLLQE